MKKGKVLLLALALLALVVGTAHAEMYVEAYLGGNFPGSSSNPMALNVPGSVTSLGFSTVGNMDPAFMGGLKLGAWFDKTGVLSGINFPAWMKYLGFYLDFSYHRVDFSERRGTVTNFGVVYILPGAFFFKSEGNAATLAFMFAFRYGFFPDRDVPFGRLQPYVAVGPAILFSSQQFTWGKNGWPLTPLSWKSPSDSSVNIALAVEAGLRWMALKNVSLDLSFKYRYAQPTYNYTFFCPGLIGLPVNFRLSPDFNFFSVQVGAAYHF